MKKRILFDMFNIICISSIMFSFLFSSMLFFVFNDLLLGFIACIFTSLLVYLYVLWSDSYE